MGANGHTGDDGDAGQGGAGGGASEYDLMLELEQLESLEEDMVELGVTTLDEVRARIARLHEQLDQDE